MGAKYVIYTKGLLPRSFCWRSNDESIFHGAVAKIIFEHKMSGRGKYGSSS